MQVSATRGVPYNLQSAATTGNGKVIAIPNSFRKHKITITSSAGISAGAIQIETSDNPSFAGTWAPVGGGPIALVANSNQILDFEGIFPFIRARVSTNVVGGTVSVTYEGI
jgi:hypothetical protein